MEKVTVKELFKSRKKRTVVGGCNAYEIDNLLYLIYPTGRIEMVLFSEIYQTKKGILLKNKEVKLIDEGIY